LRVQLSSSTPPASTNFRIPTAVVQVPTPLHNLAFAFDRTVKFLDPTLVLSASPFHDTTSFFHPVPSRFLLIPLVAAAYFLFSTNSKQTNLFENTYGVIELNQQTLLQC
jgi:hypothetical protein